MTLHAAPLQRDALGHKLDMAYLVQTSVGRIYTDVIACQVGVSQAGEGPVSRQGGTTARKAFFCEGWSENKM